ncbi:MAG TPA: hypothetical protein VHX62_10250 [Solirubrobacteraceae bacterium]|nr:hypothetical protein [Solirubrobacteraceae bacterium]
MLALLVAASEPSKVPFYIAGGALAIWAVVLSSIGLTRPSFPYNIRGQRTVVAITFVIVVVAIAMAIHTSAFAR